TVGAFNLGRFVVNNWWQVSLAVVLLLIIAHFILLFGKFAYYSYHLRSGVHEKEILLGLMKEVQKDCFSRGKLSMEEYSQSISGYEKRLNEVVSSLIMYANKKHNLFRFWISKTNRLLAEKTQLLRLIKDNQRLYLKDNALETRVYNNRMKSYSSRLGEIEEQLAFIEAQRSLKKHSFSQDLHTHSHEDSSLSDDGGTTNLDAAEIEDSDVVKNTVENSAGKQKDVANNENKTVSGKRVEVSLVDSRYEDSGEAKGKKSAYESEKKNSGSHLSDDSFEDDVDLLDLLDEEHFTSDSKK
ncbi:MAG: hypothetical protein ACOCQQ_03640, partial [Candidatus Nanoarchaeia archaeon]